MIKRLALAFTAVTVLCSTLSAPIVRAGGGSAPVELSASASSTTANGTSKITFTAFVYYTMCSDDSLTTEPTCSGGATVVGKQPVKNAPVNVYVTSGSDVVLSGTSFTTDVNGKASFTAASTAAGSKVITVSKYDAAHPTAVSKTVTFTAPAPAPSAPKTTSTPAPTPVVTTQAVAAPATPASTGFEVNGQVVASSEKPIVEQNKPFVLKGTTVPNGVVKLYIFSTPREATVTADNEGKWSYEIKGLEPGSHHVEAEVTDPKTQKTSERKTLAEFTITAAPASAAPASVQSNSVSSKKPLALGVIAVVLALVAIAVWLLIRYNKKHHAMAVAGAATTIVPRETETGVDETATPTASDESPPVNRDGAGTDENSSKEQPKP